MARQDLWSQVCLSSNSYVEIWNQQESFGDRCLQPDFWQVLISPPIRDPLWCDLKCLLIQQGIPRYLGNWSVGRFDLVQLLRRLPDCRPEADQRLSWHSGQSLFHFTWMVSSQWNIVWHCLLESEELSVLEFYWWVQLGSALLLCLARTSRGEVS